jgi:hypothetical protein
MGFILNPSRSGAFSSEVGTGSRQENASNQKFRAPFRFHRNGRGSGMNYLAYRDLISRQRAARSPVKASRRRSIGQALPR